MYIALPGNCFFFFSNLSPAESVQYMLLVVNVITLKRWERIKYYTNKMNKYSPHLYPFERKSTSFGQSSSGDN